MQKWWLEEGYVDEEHVPVPEWHLAVLQERLARYESEDKTKWKTLEEFEKEIEEFIRSLRDKK